MIADDMACLRFWRVGVAPFLSFMRGVLTFFVFSSCLNSYRRWACPSIARVQSVFLQLLITLSLSAWSFGSLELSKLGSFDAVRLGLLRRASV